MIEKIYSKYFQKSRSFLYPILGIKKSKSFTPACTYISIEEVVSADDMKLIVVFEPTDSEEFTTFEQEELLSNPLFDQVMKMTDYNVYVFDLEKYKQDWTSFILGKYSQLSTVAKRAIKKYYGENSAEYELVDSYLFPDKYYDTYARLLGVEVQLLETARELCDPCNIDKETLKLSVEDLENLKKVI